MQEGKNTDTQKTFGEGALSGGGHAHQLAVVILPDKVHTLSSCKTTAVRAVWHKVAIFILSLSLTHTHTPTLSLSLLRTLIFFWPHLDQPLVQISPRVPVGSAVPEISNSMKTDRHTYTCPLSIFIFMTWKLTFYWSTDCRISAVFLDVDN